MGDPPDDPGGTVPPVSNYVTIDGTQQTRMDALCKAAFESSMDTDGSVAEGTNPSRKRQYSRAICRTCNKKKRRQGSKKKEGPNDCLCNNALNDAINLEKANNDDVIWTEKNSFSQIQNQHDTNTTQTHIKHNMNLTHIHNSSQSQKPPVLPIPTQPLSTSDSKVNDNNARVPVGRTHYEKNDASPYIIHVQKKTSEQNDGTTLHPVTFGRFLKKHNIQNIVNGSLKRIGRNRITLAFTTHDDANAFLNNQTVHDVGYKTFIPTFNVTRMGVVRGVPKEWSEEEILENVTVPIGCGAILKVRLLKKKMMIAGSTAFENTGTVVFTFDGQVLPTRIYMCYTALLVDLYIYPTVQCYNCCRYGHVKSQCRSSPKCYKCGEEHSGNSCDIDEEDYWCCLCKGHHEATSRKCLEYNRQRSIKETMSKSCISYMEAVKLHPPINKISYADALLSTAPTVSSQHKNYPSPSPRSPNKQSYKKTIFLQPRSLPKMGKSCDMAAHNEIIKNPPLPKNQPIFKNKENDETKFSDIIQFLIKLLSQSKTISPSNVAIIIDELYKSNNLYNGSQVQGDSMELPKSQQ